MQTQLADLLLNDRGFAFDPTSGETYQLNTTGLCIVRCLQRGMSEEAILAEMLQTYDVDEHTARRDLEGFWDEMEQLGWKS